MSADAPRVFVEFQAVANHGYPYHGACSGCGWRSIGYASDQAARLLAAEHVCPTGGIS